MISSVGTHHWRSVTLPTHATCWHTPRCKIPFCVSGEQLERSSLPSIDRFQHEYGAQEVWRVPSEYVLVISPRTLLTSQDLTLKNIA
jgi:hypothetical protein